MKALVISFKFNVGHLSHLIASYKQLRDLGIQSYLLINKKNIKYLNQECEIINKRKILFFKKIDYVLFWFPSVLNIFMILYLKLFHKSTIIYVFHEPIFSYRDYFKLKLSFKDNVIFILADFVNILTCCLSDEVILPSKISYNIYKDKYYTFNKNHHLMPLIYDDELRSEIDFDQKQYFSYIGNISEHHGFSSYLTFVEAYLTNIDLKKIKFCIATKSSLGKYQNRILNLKKKYNDNLILKYGNPMDNDTINHYYKISFAIWNAYNRSNQSGVLPKSFMFYTPVVTTDLKNSLLVNNENSIFIQSNENFEEILDSLIKIESNRQIMFVSSRNTFCREFHYSTTNKVFSNILKIKL